MERTRDSEAHGGHRARMRQRVRSDGFEGLEPHELIEFLLFYAIPRQDVNELAHRLVRQFGSARAVLEAPPEELARVSGVGARTAKWLSLVGEAARACASLSAADRPLLRNCVDALRYSARAARELTPPCGVQLCLDAAGRLVYRRELCPSLSWGEPDVLRDALRDMLLAQASSAILLLMTGVRAPDPEDYDVERAAGYAAALRAAGCELLDVILTDGGRFVSMRREGLISRGGEAPGAGALREDYLLGVPGGELFVRDFREPADSAPDHSITEGEEI